MPSIAITQIAASSPTSRRHDTQVDGEPVPYSMRTAVTDAADVSLELIEPLDGPSDYRRFLDERAAGCTT